MKRIAAILELSASLFSTDRTRGTLEDRPIELLGMLHFGIGGGPLFEISAHFALGPRGSEERLVPNRASQVASGEGKPCPRELPTGHFFGNVSPGLINPWWINRGVSAFKWGVMSYHCWREHPPNNGTGLLILGQH